jgi:Uma2 family endonuclease
MNIHSVAPAPTDSDAFLRWNLGREGRRELVHGKVVEMMINVTRAHARVTRDVLTSLDAHLDKNRFEVFAVDFGMRTPAGVRYPDIVVDVVGGEGSDLAVIAPILVCEVLSPSSLALDLVEKQAEYVGIPSLEAYLVLSQDEPRGWLWSRSGEAWTGPAMIEADGVVDVPALSLTLPLLTLYGR